MAASTMMLQTSALGFRTGLSSKFQALGTGSPSLATFRRRQQQMISCEAGNNGIPGGLKEAVDQATKKTITKEEILRNQETNDSEKKLVMGTEPSTSGSFYPRPEIESRPETGDLSFNSIFAFLGAASETINGRLLFTYASLVPIVNGESTDAQSFGSFTAQAERWNGRYNLC